MLNSYFEQYKQGWSYDKVLNMIAQDRMKYDVNKNFDVAEVLNYEKVKERIVARLINYDTNRELLSDRPHTRVENLAVTYHIDLGGDKEENYSVPIQNRMLAYYGIEVEELHRRALENTERIFPTRLKRMNEVLNMGIEEMAEILGLEEEEMQFFMEELLNSDHIPMYVMSNVPNMYGAIGILNPDNQKMIAEELGGDYYVLPSSIHEVICIPKEPDMTYQELEEMVKEVNRDKVSLEDRLSDSVYEYDTTNHVLIQSKSAEEHHIFKEEETCMEHKKTLKHSQAVRGPKL